VTLPVPVRCADWDETVAETETLLECCTALAGAADAITGEIANIAKAATKMRLGDWGLVSILGLLVEVAGID
jgi:hypothetical protein